MSKNFRGGRAERGDRPPDGFSQARLDPKVMTTHKFSIKGGAVKWKFNAGRGWKNLVGAGNSDSLLRVPGIGAVSFG